MVDFKGSKSLQPSVAFQIETSQLILLQIKCLVFIRNATFSWNGLKLLKIHLNDDCFKIDGTYISPKPSGGGFVWGEDVIDSVLLLLTEVVNAVPGAGSISGASVVTGAFNSSAERFVENVPSGVGGWSWKQNILACKSTSSP